MTLFISEREPFISEREPFVSEREPFFFRRRQARKLTGDNVEKEEGLQVTMLEGVLGREFVVMLLRVVE